MVRTNLSLPEDLWELVRAEAFTRKVSQTCVVREALRDRYKHGFTEAQREYAEKEMAYSRSADLFHAPKKKSKDELPKLVPRRL